MTKKTPLPPLTPANPGAIYNVRSDVSWGVSDPARFGELMAEAAKLTEGGVYYGDNLFTWMRNNSAADDGAFMRAWQANVLNGSDEAALWRRYILCCAAYHCVHLDGDFVECGVLFGTAVKTVVDFFGRESFAKTFWAYDTFDTNPTGHHFPGQQTGLYERVKARFEGYSQVRLVRGLLPAALEGNSPQKIAYLHIDMNSAEFEVAVLERLFGRIVPGGILVLDDYEWSGAYRAQKIAHDAWFEARQYRVFPLPTGQGLVLKR
jgi:hypothetical protein